MNKLKNFLDFVEMRTKIASVLPFFVGTGYFMYRYRELDVYKTILFFGAMLLFDMTATAINNHVGTRQQSKKNNYSDGLSVAIILLMLAGASVLGIYLAYITNLVVLLTGIFCFGIGILYSFGPLPISRTPFGEIFSGIVMGTCIPFLVSIINDPTLLTLELDLPKVFISMNVWDLFCLGVVVLPLICCISNIMLANNICDVEEDIKVKRFTLPYYIGKEYALKLFGVLYAGAFFFILAGVVIRILPLTALIGFAGVVPVFKNIKVFQEQQIKEKTFGVAIKNFLLITVPYMAGIWLSVLLHIIF